MRLNVEPCSSMKPWAAPRMTASSAPGMRSASSSLSPIGVRMSWLPTSAITGTVRPPSSPLRLSSMARMASTWATKA